MPTFPNVLDTEHTCAILSCALFACVLLTCANLVPAHAPTVQERDLTGEKIVDDVADPEGSSYLHPELQQQREGWSVTLAGMAGLRVD